MSDYLGKVDERCKRCFESSPTAPSGPEAIYIYNCLRIWWNNVQAEVPYYSGFISRPGKERSFSSSAQFNSPGAIIESTQCRYIQPMTTRLVLIARLLVQLAKIENMCPHLLVNI